MAYDYERTLKWLDKDDTILKGNRKYASQLKDLKNWYNSATGNSLTVTEIRNSGESFHTWVQRVANAQQVAREGFITQRRVQFYRNVLGQEYGETEKEKQYYYNLDKILSNHRRIKKIMNKKSKDDLTQAEKREILIANKENQLLLLQLNNDLGKLGGGFGEILENEIDNYTYNQGYADRIFNSIYESLRKKKSNISIDDMIDAYGTDDEDYNLGMKLYLKDITSNDTNKVSINEILWGGTGSFNQESIDFLKELVSENVTLYFKDGRKTQGHLYEFLQDTIDTKVIWNLIHSWVGNGKSQRNASDYNSILEDCLHQAPTKNVIFSCLSDKIMAEVIRIEVIK